MLSTSLKNFLLRSLYISLLLLSSFPEKKLYPLYWGYQSWPSWISSHFYHYLPETFHLFPLTPLEIHVFSWNVGISPWNYNNFYWKSPIFNIPISQTSLYLKHPSISNIPLFQTSLYLKHPSISNIPLSRTPLYLEHPSISNIPPSQTSLHLKHPSISNIPLS